MKKLIGILIITFFSSFYGFTYESPQNLDRETIDSSLFRDLNQKSFKAGEVLKYSLNYGWMTAGEATLEVKNTSQKINGRDLYHIIGTGRSVNTFDWFFKVRDKYETYMDVDGVFPWLFIRNINEGGYSKSQNYQFFQHKKMVKNEKNEEYKVPMGVQDMLSSFYYARTLDFSKAKKGDVFTIPTFVDEEYFELKIRYIGTDQVKINKGKFDCMVFNPVLQKGRIFEDEEDLTVYISNDKNKVPVLVKAKILVGSIRMELDDYSGLNNPIAKVN